VNRWASPAKGGASAGPSRRAAAWTGIALGMALVAGGCFGSGGDRPPATVHWDRDQDEECGMVVSDRRFAAQAIEPGGRAHVFDDVGCMIVWLDRQSWQSEARLWVRDRNADRWIAPEQARWRAGEHTPSAYGFGASQEAAYGSLSFDQVRLAVRDTKTRRRMPEASGAPRRRQP